MSLTDYPHDVAAELREWLGEDDKRVASGVGAIIRGETEAGYDLSLLCARALVKTTVPKLICLSLTSSLDYDMINELWEDKRPILLTNFMPSSQYYDAEMYKRIENLISHYLDNCIPVLVHIPSLTEQGDLLNPVLWDRLQKINKTFIIE